MLKKRVVIKSQVISRIRRTTLKNGIKAPVSTNHASEIDSSSNNAICQDSIAKEMTRIGVAFDTLETGQVAPVGCKISSDHITFDVKWISLERSDRHYIDTGFHHLKVLRVLE